MITRASHPLARFLLWLALAIVAPVGCQAPDPLESGASPIDDLAPGWNQIRGDGTTSCALATPFSFFAWPGDPKRLVVYFQGGGACWNGGNCDIFSEPTYDPIIEGTDHPSRAGGLLDLDNPANPVREFSVVVVPYCTGDLHLGTRTATYQSNRTFQVRHWGAANAAFVLDWISQRVPDPEIVVVAGSSAGAIASAFYASQIAARYPSARVAQLGDAAGAYRVPGLGALLGPSGAFQTIRGDPAFQSLDAASFTFEALYVGAAQAHPNLTLAQYNNVEDATQRFFLQELGLSPPFLAPLLAANLADIRRGDPDFRAYTAPGVTHTILLRPEFYTLIMDGIGFRDWATSLIFGQAVSDVGASLLGTGP